MPGSRRRAVGRFAIVLVTAPDVKGARKLAEACFKARAAACVNIVPRVESHYWWQGKVERGNEVLMVIKTMATRLNALERCVLANHPYDTPEFVVLPISSGNRRYLEWIAGSVK